MKVKIICGTYGHRPNKDESRVVRKDSTSQPFELDDKEAQRIIALGVAKACNETDSFEELYDGIDKTNISDRIMGMEYTDMKKLAKEWGVSAKGTKKELRERLMQAGIDNGTKADTTGNQDLNDDTSQNAEDDQNNQSVWGDADQGGGDNDKPPVLNPQEPV